MYQNFIKILTTPQEGKKLGIFTITIAIFGGLISAYLGMVSLALILPFKMEDLSVISLLFNTLAWALIMLWILLSPTKLSVLLRFIVPSSIFTIIIYFLY